MNGNFIKNLFINKIAQEKFSIDKVFLLKHQADDNKLSDNEFSAWGWDKEVEKRLRIGKHYNTYYGDIEFDLEEYSSKKVNE